MKLGKFFSHFLLGISLACGLVMPVLAELPTEQSLQQQLKTAKAADQKDPAKQAIVKNIEETLVLLAKISKQKTELQTLEQDISNAPKATANAQSALDNLKNNELKTKKDFEKWSLVDLQTQLAITQQSLQKTQGELAELNALLVSQRSAPERAQASLSANLTRTQEIDKLLFNNNIESSEKVKLEAEVGLLELQNSYNQTLLQGNNDLTALYSVQVDEKNLQQQQLQAKLTALQEVINDKNLQETQQQADLLSKSQLQIEGEQSLVAEQTRINVQISQDLVKQTTQLNRLSQDNLRIKSVLDNLQQTERNINEQISALQGTLVLSRIINKQKQLLPQDQFIHGLSKQITDLRVRIFDLTELRDSLYDTQTYIANLAKKNNIELTSEEKTKLAGILQERRKLVSDTITTMNNQLNLAINIELNQKQVMLISDTLQGKLQQQSFWVKSNAPMDLDWLRNAVERVSFELEDISNHINFSNWKENLLPATLLILLFLTLAMLILWRKSSIKLRLAQINSKLNDVESDSQWCTPIAVFWSLVLCLPSTFFFLSGLIFITYICFESPEKFWWWSLKMAGYWLFFAFMLAMLRPNGLAYRHFNMPQANVQIFHTVLKKSVWISALWLNADMFTHLDAGITNDVIGQVMTVFVLLGSLLIVGPRLSYAVQAYQEQQQGGYWFKVIRLSLVIVPIILILLIVMGYYYTALNLMQHLMSSYFVFMAWLVLKDIIYRGFSVSARRLAFRRAQDKQPQHSVRLQEHSEEMLIDPEDDILAISQVKDQVLRMADLLLWVSLFALLYWVWSDLITVAYYLEGVTLWQQSITTDKGVVMESITLLNLLLAMVIILATYALVRNIGGLLEVLIFSRLKLSQGTPYTVTTLLTYFIIAIGAGVAFSTLGMAWSKLQWLFTGLTVGLGFGLQAIFANFVSGIIILFERPVRIGDFVTIGTFSGTVSKIRIRSTTLIDSDKKEVIVPNQAFITERLVNWALTDSMTRVVISIGVAYGSDLELVRKLLLQAANECVSVLKDPEPTAFFLAFGASTLDHELRVYVGKLSDRTKTTDFLNRRINELFAQHQIDIAFNQLDVFIKNQGTSEEVKLGSERLPIKN